MEQTAKATQTVAKALDEFTAPIYEEICRDEVNRGLLGEATGTGWPGARRWWDRTREVDILAFSEDRCRVLLGECKWSQKAVGMNILQELETTFPATGLSVKDLKPIYVLFSRAGFTPQLLSTAKDRPDIVLVHGLSVHSP